jgi:hypothetical protein
MSQKPLLLLKEQLSVAQTVMPMHDSALSNEAVIQPCHYPSHYRTVAPCNVCRPIYNVMFYYFRLFVLKCCVL